MKSLLGLLFLFFFGWGEASAQLARMAEQNGRTTTKTALANTPLSTKPLVRLDLVSGFADPLETRALTASLEGALAEDSSIRLVRQDDRSATAQYLVDVHKVRFTPYSNPSAAGGRCADGKLSLTILIKRVSDTTERSLDLALAWPALSHCDIAASELKPIVDIVLAMHLAGSGSDGTNTGHLTVPWEDAVTTARGGSTSVNIAIGSNVPTGNIVSEGGSLAINRINTRDRQGRLCLEIYSGRCIVQLYTKSPRYSCTPRYLYDPKLNLCMLPSDFGGEASASIKNGKPEGNSQPSSATDTISGSKIKGDTTINAVAGEVTTAAMNASVAETQIGSISGVTIEGNTIINVTHNPTNAALGANSCADTKIGVIGGRNCSPENTAEYMPKGSTVKAHHHRAPSASGVPARSIEGLDNAPFIPWPPPDPTSMGDVTSRLPLGKKYGDVATEIARRLAARGYEELRYFRAGERGFAITTDLERIDDEGNPTAQRWETTKTTSFTSLLDYGRSLIMGKRGNLRLFAFVIMDGDLQPDPQPANQSIVENWQARGRRQLSAIRAAVPVTDATRVYLLVYEFAASNSKKEDYKAKPKGHPFSFHANALGLR